MSTTAEEAPHTEASLRRSAKIGSALALVQTVAGKATTVVGQLVLAWFLTPAETGLANLATSINGLLIFFNPLIMSDVLLARRKTFEEDAAPAFWSTMLLALATIAFLLAIAFPIENWSDKPGLALLLAVLAVRPLLMVLQLIPYTALRTGLRFGSLTTSNVTTAVGSMLLGIGLAAGGAGGYAIVVPQVAALLVGAIMFIRAARPLPPLPFQLRGAKPLTRAYTVASAGQYSHAISLFISSLLGFAASDAETGLFFFAFNLSAQINGAFAYSISLALQPIFAHLAHDRPAQLRSYFRNTTAIGVVTTPICVLQAVLAIPALHLFFPERWWQASTVLLVLSIGQQFYFAMGCTASLFKAQGRFTAYFLWQTIQSALLVPAVAAAVWMVGPWLEDRYGIAHGRALAVAVVIAVQYAISCPAGAFVATRGQPGAGRQVFLMFAVPIGAAMLAGAVAWPLTLLFPDGRLAAFLTCAITTAVFAVAYLAFLRLFSKDLANALVANAANGIRRALARLSRQQGDA